jgi:hypothetical protein
MSKVPPISYEKTSREEFISTEHTSGDAIIHGLFTTQQN